jgi:putative Mg2+ transporter-C (MgtC) family protein
MEISSFSSEFEIQIFLRVIIATILGAIVGYERERAGKAAGLRTHGTVGFGAVLFTTVSIYGFENGDPGRVASQIVAGIGFIGAGIILHWRGNVEGLTTAATLWVTAAIGLAVGVGMVWLSLAATSFIFVFLHFSPRVSQPDKQQNVSASKSESTQHLMQSAREN